MKKFLTLLASLVLTTAMWAQTCGPGTGANVCSFGPVTGVTGQPIQMPSNGGLVPGFNYICSSGSCTVTLQACIGNSTGCVLLDSYTGGSTVRTPDQFSVKPPSAAFQYFIVTPTFASGTFSVLEVNNNTASSGNGSGSHGGTIPNTTNVLKGDGTGNAAASSIKDDGTNPTQTPNGLTTGNNGLSNTELPINASSGTVVNETVCFGGSGGFQTTVCPSNSTFGVLGIAGVGAGNSGNVDICTTQCKVFFDGTSAIGNWAVPSATAGYLHDTGSTVLPTNAQAFLIDSVSSGSGQLATVDVFSPYVLFSNQGRAQIVKINGGLSAVVVNFNGTTPAAPGGNTNVTWQTSTSAGVTSASAYIPNSSGLTNVVMPADLYASSITSNVETVTKQPQSPSFVLKTQPINTRVPFLANSNAANPCALHGTTTLTCNPGFTSSASHLIHVSVSANGTSFEDCASHPMSVTDNLTSTYTTDLSSSCSTAGTQIIQEFWLLNSAAGINSIILTVPAGSQDVNLIVEEWANIKTSAALDANVASGFFSCSPPAILPSITTTNANDLIIATMTSRGGNHGNWSAIAPFSLIATVTSSTNDFSNATEFTNVSAANTYTPTANCPGGSSLGNVLAFKASTAQASDLPIYSPLFPEDLQPIAVGPIYNANGLFQNALPHTVADSCVLGTSCAVTLVGSAIYTSSSSYHCMAQDSTGIHPTAVSYSSGSAFTITGTGTDTIHYICVGD